MTHLDTGQLNIIQNMLLEWNPTRGVNGDEPVIERVLDFDLNTDAVVVINILDPHAFPALRSHKEIQQAHQERALVVRENHPFSRLVIPEDKISVKLSTM